MTDSSPSTAVHLSLAPTSWLDRHATAVRWGSIAVLALSLLAILSRLPVADAIAGLESRIAGLGIWGPVVYGCLYVVAVVLLAPASALTLAAGAIFGLGVGTITVSLASTTGAALAFLIARYLARERVAAKVEAYPKFAAIDRAIREGGWKIVAMLRLSPAVPFNLQNYLYGLTGIGFWTCVLTSWVAMLPGTFLYVYLGYVAREGAAAASGGGDGTALQWVARLVGLAATVAVTVYVTRLARRAMAEASLEGDRNADVVREKAATPPPRSTGLTPGTVALALLAVVCAAIAVLALTRSAVVSGLAAGLFGGTPTVEAREAYARRDDAATVDHSVFDQLLARHVDPDGWVDYAGLAADAKALDAYLATVAAAPWDDLDRDGKLALLINAYNAATLRLILDHRPLESIKDIPADQRWSAERWNVGGRVLSLDQIEHQEIRPHFAEPRIHFAVVCAAVGCPPLRAEAYVPERLEEQLAEQAAYVHSHDRWLRYSPGADVVYLTKLYDWYGGDFEQAAGSVLDHAARHAPTLAAALARGKRPAVRWLDYDWALNDVSNRP